MAKDVQLNEPLIEFFQGSNIKAVQRVLERAQRKAESEARRLSSATRPRSRAGLLVKAMNAAMSAYGRATKNAPSIRQTARDTGGRPYHFGYSTVTKGEGGRSRGAKRAKAASGGPAAAGGATPTEGKAAKKDVGRGANRANTREAAHQIYTERDGAVDHDSPPVGQDAGQQIGQDTGEDTSHDKGPSGPEAEAATLKGPDAARAFAEGAARDAGLGGASTEASAQQYMEDEAKSPPLLGRQSSFGTIGETLQERMAFWDLVHERESDKGGRTQTRMVLELPHEATPAERHEIVRLFTDDLRRKGIPFWASIHAPTKENDARNHHAHVVCTDRPMRRMPHPETGAMTWDFAVMVVRKTKTSGNRFSSYPHRQNRDPEMRDRGYVKKSRARLAEVVNEVMSRSGRAVKYDPRSYRDMGLEAAPMRNVSRIIADKLDRKSFIVMDAAWTRRMIDAEVEAAAARRSQAFVRLQEAEVALQQRAKAAERSAKENARLPRHLRLSVLGTVGRAASEPAIAKVLAVRRDRLAADFVDGAVEAALRHVARATSPAAPGGPGAPTAENLRALHEAALEELAEHQAGRGLSRKGFAARQLQAEREWRAGRQPAAALAPAARRPGAAPGAGRTGMPETYPSQRLAALRGPAPDDDEEARPAAAPYRNLPTPWLPGGGPAPAPGAVAQRMSSSLQPLINMGLSGSEFAEALDTMIKEMAGTAAKDRADAAAAARRTGDASPQPAPPTPPRPNPAAPDSPAKPKAARGIDTPAQDAVGDRPFIDGPQRQVTSRSKAGYRPPPSAGPPRAPPGDANQPPPAPERPPPAAATAQPAARNQEEAAARPGGEAPTPKGADGAESVPASRPAEPGATAGAAQETRAAPPADQVPETAAEAKAAAEKERQRRRRQALLARRQRDQGM